MRSRAARYGSAFRQLGSIAAVLLAIGACGGTTETQTQSEAGTYSLLNVNGQSLPVTITNTSLGTVIIQSASVVLTPGSPGTYTASITGRVGGGPTTTIVSDAGSYVRSGASVTFTSSNSPFPYTGTINGSNGHLTVALPGAAIGATGTATLQLELAKS